MKKKFLSALVLLLLTVFFVGISDVASARVYAATKKPTKITVKTTSKTVDINGKVTVKVDTVTPKNASKEVKFKSSDKEVATVTSKGVVTGKKKGSVTITVNSKEDKSVKAKIKITVKDVKPKSVTLSKTSYSGYIGNTKTLTAKVKPAYSNQKVTYKSSNKNVATVNSSGKITLISHGTATITATTSQKNADGKTVKATCKVTVKDRADADIDWNYMDADKVLAAMDKKENLIVLDVRIKSGYSKGHVMGSVWIPAGTVNTNNKQKMLRTNQIDELLKENDTKIVIVGGIKASKRAVSVLKNLEDIPLSRLYILKGGSDGLLENYSDRLTEGVETFKGEYVISASKFKSMMDAGDKIKIVDTRGIGSKKVTVKGATTMTWKMISKSEKSDGTQSGEAGYARTLEANEISGVLSSLGLGVNDQIILISDEYENGGWGDDGRILWQLLQCGYQNVKIVDGGISALKDVCGDEWEDYSQTGPSDSQSKTVTVDSVNQNLNNITTEDLLELYKSDEDFKVVDVRANAEYNGEILYGEVSGGHLKDAVHLRFIDLFRTDGTLKSVDELTFLFEQKGLSKDDKIITYCTGGIRSGYMCMIMKMCEFENANNYAESTYRWSNTAEAGTAEYWVK